MSQPIEVEPTEIAPEHLIRLVSQRPVLWDATIEGYKSKIETKKAWTEICSMMNTEYQNMSSRQKFEYEKSVTKKWINIRDTWLKSLKRDYFKRKAGLPGCRRYIYSKHCQFLKKVIKIDYEEEEDWRDRIPNDTKSTGSDNSIDYSGFSRASISEPEAAQEKKTTETTTEVQCRLLQILEDKDTSNPHMLFFQGILPMVNSLNLEQILNFQISVLALLKNIRNPGTNFHSPGTSNAFVRFNQPGVQPYQFQPNAQFPFIPSYILPVFYNQFANQPNVSNRDASPESSGTDSVYNYSFT